MLGDMQGFVEGNELKMKALIIGNGIASEILLDQLVRNISSVGITEFQIFHHPQLAPPCTQSSTAMMALRGTRQGVSPLGDEIFEAHSLASRFYPDFKSAFFTRSYQLIDFEDKARLRRYSHADDFELSELPLTLKTEGYVKKFETCYILNPSMLMSELQARNTNDFIERKEELVTQMTSDKSKWVIQTLGGGEYQGDILFQCTGAYQPWLQVEGEPPIIPVQGSYLEFEINLNKPSFSINIGKTNLVYRQEDQKLLIGSTSQLGDFFKPANLIDLKKYFEKSLNTFPELEAKLTWEDARICTGIRARSKSRRMMVEQISSTPDAWLFNGFYKNGFSLPLLGAKKIIDHYLKKKANTLTINSTHY